ncbi:hypothetical protein N8251_00100 [Alphaproteobacteria bacterium]|nr:hypothetical protein [Alphaproteobacteria bacterium]
MTKFLLYFFLNIFLIHNYSFSSELFGYKLYSNIYQYINDGKINYNNEDIDTIEITKDRVKIPNTYLTQYIIKSTVAGNIYEIQGSNNKLDISPVECLSVQEIFINSFEERNSDLFLIEKKKLPMNLKSKITWDLSLFDKIKNNNFIFSVTCDYSFNNRRMDIVLSDKDFMNRESKTFNNLQETKKENINKSKIDTSGI